MNMKKLIAVALASFMAFASLFAEDTESAIVTKSFDLKDFNGLSVSSTFSVTLVKSPVYSVKVICPDYVADYLTVNVSGGILKLGLENLPQSVKRRMEKNDPSLAAVIAMPQIGKLSLSGASSLKCDDRFDIGDNPFNCDLSGASRLDQLEISAGDLSIEASGASCMTLAGKFRNIEMELSGAVKTDFKIDGKKLNLEASGASCAELSGRFISADIDASGASVLNLSGAVSGMTLSASGASAVKAVDFWCKDVSAEVHGASSARVFAAGTLDIDVSGASSLYYKLSGSGAVGKLSVSRASLVKRLD